MTAAHAPGKVILFGEHAVVYGRPAIAVPVRQVSATVQVTALPENGGDIWIEAPDVGFASWLATSPPEQPLARMIRLVLETLEIRKAPGLRVRVTSTIPIASGLGSGTAVSVALGRALSRHLGRMLTPEQLSALAYDVDRIHHGTPSGIDNTVVAYERPVYFVRGVPPVVLRIGRSFSLVIADSGEPSSTRLAVESVRRMWETDRESIERTFDDIARIVEQAREALERGDVSLLGPLMNQNQALLESLSLSTDRLRRLSEAALAAGALGAKLSGAGRGGNLIALVEPATAPAVVNALGEAGASRTMLTEVSA